jgi:hypothetical protein
MMILVEAGRARVWCGWRRPGGVGGPLAQAKSFISCGAQNFGLMSSPRVRDRGRRNMCVICVVCVVSPNLRWNWRTTPLRRVGVPWMIRACGRRMVCKGTRLLVDIPVYMQISIVFLPRGNVFLAGVLNRRAGKSARAKEVSEICRFLKAASGHNRSKGCRAYGARDHHPSMPQPFRAGLTFGGPALRA